MNRSRALIVSLALLVIATASNAPGALKAQPPRQVISLDGEWQVGQGSMKTTPDRFDHTVPVPGLLDMAEPAFADVGKKRRSSLVALRYSNSYREDICTWAQNVGSYRKVHIPEPLP